MWSADVRTEWDGRSRKVTDLGVFAALEEWCDTDKSDIVVPHDCVLFIVVWDLECILEN